MKRDTKLYLEDILESINLIEEYAKGTDEDHLQNDPKLQDAVVRRFEIIGEAIRQMPQAFKDRYPDVPWRQIAGMRDVIAHEYFGVNVGRIWNTIQKDLPPLKQQIRNISERL